MDSLESRASLVFIDNKDIFFKQQSIFFNMDFEVSAIKAAIRFVMILQIESKGALKITAFTIDYLLLAVSNERFRVQPKFCCKGL